MSDKEQSMSREESATLVERGSQATSIQTAGDEGPLIPDEKIVNYFEEAIQCIKDDRQEAYERYLQFADMVVNEGDPSSASKEAMTTLLKIKSDGVGQMTKILDLWMRMKLKEKTTSSQVYAYQQNNKYEVGSGPNPHVRKLIKMAQQLDEKED